MSERQIWDWEFGFEMQGMEVWRSLNLKSGVPVNRSSDHRDRNRCRSRVLTPHLPLPVPAIAKRRMSMFLISTLPLYDRASAGPGVKSSQIPGEILEA